MIAHANRGSALEALVIMANNAYRARKIGVIHKVPTAWLPIRDGTGKVASAKVQEKAAVDFIGHVRIDGHALPVAFDCKETRQDKWPLSRLEPHQYEYLADCHATGACAFVLLGFVTRDRYFVLPFPALQKYWEKWQEYGRPASVRIDDPALIEVRFPEYLKWLNKEALLCRNS